MSGAFSQSYCGKYMHARRPNAERRCFATPPIALSTASTAATSTTPMRLQLSASGVTDPGRPGKQNQDAYFMLQDADREAMVLGVFDGHGRETGKDAALTAKAFFEAHFRSFTADQYEQLDADPHTVFTQLFRSCHEMIKSVFRGIYEQRGYMVQEVDGSLVRKDRDDDDDDDGICIRGGTCATVVVLLHGGRKIISANVGDSAVLIGTHEPMLSNNDVLPRVRGKGGVDIPKKKTEDGVVPRFNDEIKNEYVLLTGNHSADSESEFLRVRKHSFGSPEAQVQFVYDCSTRTTPRAMMKKRLPIFNVSPRGLIHQNMIGDYYKNVRDEWATIVTTPAEAPFSDSLAFTRSLGDFHMHAYGVCDEPTVQEISLESVLSQRSKNLQTRVSPDSVQDMDGSAQKETETTELFLVVASDGVWDNWKYEELMEFLVEHNKHQDEPEQPQGYRFWTSSPSTTSSISQNPEKKHSQCRVDRLTASLMETNIHRADRIFGDQADNMTAIVCQIQCILD